MPTCFPPLARCGRDGAAAAVMLTSPSYPAEQFPLSLPISGTDAARDLPHVNLFHHGTACENGRLITSRGRVLAVTAVADSLPCALRRAYRGVDKISFAGAQYRRDVGGGIVPRLQRPPVFNWSEERVEMGTAV